MATWRLFSVLYLNFSTVVVQSKLSEAQRAPMSVSECACSPTTEPVGQIVSRCPVIPQVRD